MTEVQFAKQFLTTLDAKTTKYQSDHVFDPRTFQTRIPYTLPKLSHPPHPLPPAPQAISSAATTPAPSTTTTTSSRPLTLTLKSTRNPTFTLTLPSLPPSTAISTLKSHIQALLPDVAAEKIKILHAKKPIPPSKATVSDVLSGTADAANGEANVEFTVMVLGGAKDPEPKDRVIKPNDAAPAKPAEVEGGRDGMMGVEASSPAPVPVAVKEAEQKANEGQNSESQPVQPGEASGREILSSKEFWDDVQGFLEQRLRDTEEAERLRALFEKAAGVA